MDGNSGMKKILIYNKSKIFILAPANTSTGGPECLHELGYYLKNIFNKNCYMVYLPKDIKNPVHKNYLHFKLQFSNYIDDHSENILIIPEHYTFLKYSLKFKNIKKIIWWLSLDNYLGYKFREENSKLIRSIKKIPYNVISKINHLINFRFGIYTYQDYLKTIYSFKKIEKEKEVKQASYHLMQSFYVFNYFKQFKNKYLLNDYQNIILSKNKKKDKKNIICYSHKSNDFINLLKDKINAKFIILEGYKKNQLFNIFKKTKIYMDFGYHPGKDKMPREAVLFNNCIITNLKGSAKNNQDIPIKKKYKFTECLENVNKINNAVNKIFKNYTKEFASFKYYKNKTLKEKKVFINQIKKIFKKV